MIENHLYINFFSLRPLPLGFLSYSPSTIKFNLTKFKKTHPNLMLWMTTEQENVKWNLEY